MRRIILQMMLTLDGFVAGPHGEVDWHNVDEEFNEYAREFLSDVDTLLFGRVTYELMAGYWPTQDAYNSDPITAEYMNTINKIVVSRTMTEADWNNTTLIQDNIVEEISRLREQSGKQIAILGSSRLAKSLIQANVIDEYRFIVNPLVLGKGQTLFEGLEEMSRLEHVHTRTFRSGNVLLCYRGKTDVREAATNVK